MASLELEARLDNLLSTAREELVNVDLFAPIAEREECPLCLIPFPVEKGETVFSPCCGKNICCGCIYKSLSTDTANGVPVDEIKCAFCRQTGSENNVIKNLKKLMKNDNPDAFVSMAKRYRSGDGVFQSDTKSLEMYIRAAELGHVQAYALIGNCYKQGSAVEENMSRVFEFLEIAAKKGSIPAHNQLAGIHGRNGNINKAIDHVKVAASAGHQDAMDELMKAYTDKRVSISKEELTQTLRAYQASNNEMKSKDRDDARDFMKEHRM